VICSPVTREEIKQKMDELAREYRVTHDPETAEEIFELARRVREMAGCDAVKNKQFETYFDRRPKVLWR
jgi:hypothetical protein